MPNGLAKNGKIDDICGMATKQNLEITEELLARLSPEAQMIIRLLLKRIAELENQLGMTPQNSSLPPSSQHPHAKPEPPKKKKSKRKQGAQKGHKKHQRTLVPPEQVTETIPLLPGACRRCGEKLAGSDPDPLRHQVFELPKIKPIVTEYQRHKLHCACCGISTTAPLPAGVPTGQTGPRLAAFTVLLMAYFRQSKRRTALFLDSLFDIPCSAGLTIKLQNMATDALRPCYEQLAAALPRSDTVALDETPTKEMTSKMWLWTAVTKNFTLFRIADSRKADVAKEILGENFQGIASSDRYGGYDWIERRQLCWAHLLRDFESMIDAGGKAKRIGWRLKKSGQEMFHHWHRYRDGKIKRATMRWHISKLKRIVEKALQAGATQLTDKPRGKCRHILKRFEYLWTFCDYADVEPTNNVSERALRHAVIWRKLSFGTQSASGSRFVETLLSVIETCRQQQRNVFAFVTATLESHFENKRPPKLSSRV